MLTFDFDRLGVTPGVRFLDVGGGPGRHSFEAARRGAAVVIADLDRRDLSTARTWLAAMAESGEAPGPWLAVQCDALRMPFPDASFDRVTISEVLEHVPADRAAMAELFRVLKPGGRLVVTVPRWFPERVCWALSDEYHANAGGHVRVYRGAELRERLEQSGFQVTGTAHAHALHAPFWWLKCAVGVRRDDALLPSLYHRFLVWDIERRPRLTRWLERALNPVLGKSLVVYLEKPRALEVLDAA